MEQGPALPTRLRSKYRECVHRWRQILRNDQTAKEQRTIDANDLGTFYRFVNQHISNRSSVGAVIDDEGTFMFTR